MLDGPLPLRLLSHDAHTLPADAFTQMYGNAFFVHSGELDEGPRPILRTVSDRDQVVGQSVADAMQVFAVKPKAGNLFPDFISIGRAPNNDIVIGHASVSKFQAFLRPVNGGFSLQDGDSSNGTFADGNKVPKKEEGAPVHLSSGVGLRFGSVELSFLDGASLQQLAKTLCAPPAGQGSSNLMRVPPSQPSTASKAVR